MHTHTHTATGDASISNLKPNIVQLDKIKTMFIHFYYDYI